MRNFIVVSVIGIAMLVGASAASAKSSNYMYPWPSFFKQEIIAQCSQSGGDVISCGCTVRLLRQRWPYSYAAVIDRKLSNGDVVPASARRTMNWAIANCG